MSNLTATLNTNGNVVSLNGNLNNVSNDYNVDDREMIEEETPEVDINISNVVCNFSTRCHLNLRHIATNGANVEYRREQGVCILFNYGFKLKDQILLFNHVFITF